LADRWFNFKAFNCFDVLIIEIFDGKLKFGFYLSHCFEFVKCTSSIKIIISLNRCHPTTSRHLYTNFGLWFVFSRNFSFSILSDVFKVFLSFHIQDSFLDTRICQFIHISLFLFVKNSLVISRICKMIIDMLKFSNLEQIIWFLALRCHDFPIRIMILLVINIVSNKLCYITFRFSSIYVVHIAAKL
jgi:hypothetical protein